MAGHRNEILPSGHRLNSYTVQRRLSSGGFGVVYLASRADGHLVAIKEFLPSVMSCRTKDDGVQIHCRSEYDTLRFQDGLRAFFREADTLARVRDARIIPIWDVFKANGTAYFVMPLERGGTLQAAIRQSMEPFSEHELRALFIDACLGVEALHQTSLLHLDIKPSNLWLRPDRSLVVLDLGASRWEDEDVKLKNMARTPGFAAPEQHGSSGRAGISPRTDVYGLCASLLSCLLGHPPLAAPLRKPGDPSPTAALLGEASPRLLDVIATGMSLNPALRHPSVRHLRLALEALPRLPKNERWQERLSLPIQP